MAFGFAAGTERSLVGFVEVVTYSTQDSLPVAGQALLDGLLTRKVPLKGFRVVDYISSPFPKLLGARDATSASLVADGLTAVESPLKARQDFPTGERMGIQDVLPRLPVARGVNHEVSTTSRPQRFAVASEAAFLP